MTNFIVTGSHGRIAADAETGDVLAIQYEAECPCGDNCFDNIKSFDVAGWRSQYPGETLDHVDILDIGFWLKDGACEPPAVDWQKEFRRLRKKGVLWSNET